MALVLVIHADPFMREMATDMLTLEGHAVVTAPDGREGLRIMREAARPAIVFLDLLMPVLDARGVMQALQADPELRARHAIFLSAGARTLEAVGDVGADGHIAMPYTADELLDVIARGEQMLQSRQSEPHSSD
jgi:CheY-like chemotaxis protein